MNQNEYYFSPQRKRVKTEINSLRTSQMLTNQNSSLSAYKEQPNYKLPGLQRDDRIYTKDLNRINEEEGSTSIRESKQSRRNGLSLPYHQKKQIKRVEKIYDLLCSSKQPSQQIIINLKPETHSQIYQKVRQHYSQMKSSKKTKEVQQIFTLINGLKTINSLFAKMDDILSMILLKKGRIIEFQENNYVYHQNEPKNTMYVILWGQVKIKEIYRNRVKYLLPGDMLCQEVIVEEKKNGRRYFSDIGIVKGSLITLQSAKTQAKCGLLELNREIYDEIKTRYIENGQKEKILIFERMINCSLAKKSKLRK